MGFESISHTPEFKLPEYAPAFTEELRGLLEENHQGLHRVVVSKQLRRDKYDQIASITCQEGGNSKTHPQASPDEIAEYVMLCIQYDIEKTDLPGVYLIKAFGAPGKGRWERGKHIDMRGEGDAKDLKVLSEAELLEQQSNYIGELHSQLVATHETLLGMIKPLLTENKEMMKIVTEAVKHNAEVERIRNQHALEMKMHADEIGMKQAEMEQQSKSWDKLFEYVKETGAGEAIVDQFMKYMNKDKENDKDDDEEEDKKSKKEKNKKEEIKEDRKEKEEKEEIKNAPKEDIISENVEVISKNNKEKIIKKKNNSEKIIDVESKIVNEESKSEEDLIKEGLELFEKYPLVGASQGLKMSIDQNNRWDLLEKTLTNEQLEIFKSIFESDTDKKVSKLLKKLYQTKGISRLFKLNKKLDSEQQRFIEILIKEVI